MKSLNQKKVKVVKLIDDKTCKVEEFSLIRHPYINKTLKRTKTFLVDTKGYSPVEGEIVSVIYRKPISKSKSWQILSMEGSEK